MRAKEIAPLPWRVFNSAGFIAIMDANGKEILPWTGFDASCLSKTKRLALARFIVRSARITTDSDPVS